MGKTFIYIWIGAMLGLNLQATAQTGADWAAMHRIRSVEVIQTQFTPLGEELRRMEHFAYNLGGKPVSRVRFNQDAEVEVKTQFRYDSHGKNTWQELVLAARERKADVAWVYQYHQGKVTRGENLKTGLVKTFKYDEAGLLAMVETRLARGKLVSADIYQYDEAGRLIAEEQKRGLMTRFKQMHYNQEGLLVEKHLSISYQVENKPAKNLLERYQYDRKGRLILTRKSDHLGRFRGEIRYEYTRNDQLRKKIQGKKSWLYVYNEKGLIIREEVWIGNEMMGEKNYTYQFWDEMQIAVGQGGKAASRID
ncbi:MAG: hypothetical protein AAFR61_28105 [Bacteroidota bacterium]